MSLVSSTFPGMAAFRRQTVRGPVNPMDKSTVVSIYPKFIDEFKVTIQPGRFMIPPGSYDKPSILIVGPSSWWREFDEQQPLLEIPVSSIQIADSIVRDYCNGILACDMGESMPGLFFIPGEQTLKDIQEKFKGELDKANRKQKNFYTHLVKLADSLWARSMGNPLAISDDMRMAARELNLTTKDWMKDFTMVSMVRCPACGTLKNPQYPVCAACHAVDHTHPNAKDIKFTGQ
jgi:hypothetical protein